MENIALVEEPDHWCSPEGLERPEFGPELFPRETRYSETRGSEGSQRSSKGRRTSGGEKERNKNKEKTEDRTPLTNVEMNAMCLQLTFWDGMLKYGLQSRRD